MTYNSAAGFYFYNKKYAQSRMLTSNEEKFLFPTEQNNLIFSLEQDKGKILQTLDLIQNTFKKIIQIILIIIAKIMYKYLMILMELI